eukprot:jgi/Botrbrau1/660/Bobra.0161s0047.1
MKLTLLESRRARMFRTRRVKSVPLDVVPFSPALELPRDIWNIIMEKLDIGDLWCLSRTCREMKEVVGALPPLAQFVPGQDIRCSFPSSYPSKLKHAALSAGRNLVRSIMSVCRVSDGLEVYDLADLIYPDPQQHMCEECKRLRTMRDRRLFF